MIKGFLFDLDGVIVDTAVFHFRAWRKVSRKLGGDFTEAQNEQLKGISRVDSLKKIVEWTKAEVDDLQFEALQEQKNHWYLDLVSGLGPNDALPGAIDFLRQTHSKGILIALGSASKNAPMVLKKLGVTELFGAIIDGNNVINGKPHPEVFLKGAKALGLKPSECLVFEDSIAGVKAAKQAGMASVGIGKAKTLKADLHFNSLSETTPEYLLTHF
ncbi:MAG: beta-phosphoglucomutase [Bacteroidota bacterium]|nr:beta-phosphoglucomutase [Bacteroidota bacterium]